MVPIFEIERRSFLSPSLDALPQNPRIISGISGQSILTYKTEHPSCWHSIFQLFHHGSLIVMPKKPLSTGTIFLIFFARVRLDTSNRTCRFLFPSEPKQRGCFPFFGDFFNMLGHCREVQLLDEKSSPACDSRCTLIYNNAIVDGILRFLAGARIKNYLPKDAFKSMKTQETPAEGKTKVCLQWCFSLIVGQRPGLNGQPASSLLDTNHREEISKPIETVRLFCAHGPRWCLELELEPRLEPRGSCWSLKGPDGA